MAKLRFSERKGYKSVRKDIQKEDLDDKTRNSLWNVFIKYILYGAINRESFHESPIRNFIVKLWDEFFEVSIDTIPSKQKDFFILIRKYFFKVKWYEIFDFIEFIAENFPNIYGVNRSFIEACNEVLKRKLSPYRLVGPTIIEISSEEEIADIAEVLDYCDIHESIKVHITTALKMLSDRNNPDFRNSIKESINFFK